MKKKIFKIPMTWQVCGVLDVEGFETLEDAYKYANSDESPLPTESDYVDGSAETTYGIEDFIEIFPEEAKGEEI